MKPDGKVDFLWPGVLLGLLLAGMFVLTWFPLPPEHGFDYTLLYRALAIFALILLVLTLWIWKLATEIKNRKRVEAALRESEAKYRSIFENAVEGIFQTTLDGRFLSASPSFAGMLGYESPEDLIQSVKDIGKDLYVRPSERATFVDAIGHSHAATGFEQQLRRKDGSIVWVSLSARSARDESGEIVGLDGFAIDITERKRAEEALRQEKHFTDTLIDSMPGMFYVFDQQARLVRWNRQFEQFTGYDAEAISRTSAIEFIHPEDRSAVAEQIQKVFVQGDSHVEGRVLTRDGGTVPFYLTGSRISIDDKTYLLGTGLDISERVRAEAESARFQALLRSVIMQSPVPMVLVLPDGKVELFNEGCRSVLGVQDELQLPPDLNLFTMEKPWLDYTAEGVPIPLEDLPLTLALRGKTTRNREIKIVRRDGTERWILADAVPVLDAPGTIIAGFLVFVDITKRKRAEEALTASQEFLSSIIENIPNMIFIKDAKDLRFVAFNRAGEELLGYGREELIGKSDYDLFVKEQADSFTRTDREVLERGQALNIPAEPLETRMGIRILHTKKIPLMDSKGEPAYLLGISEDITERVKADEALRTNEANLQLAFEAGRLGDWTWDMVTGEIYWSARCKALYGVSPDVEITYDRFLELVHSEDRARVGAALRQAVATKGDYNVEKRVIWPDGSVHWNATLGRVFCNAEGQPVRLAGVTLDITERKRAEMELLREKQFTEKLLESLPGIFFLYDSTCHLKRWNKAHESAMGFTADELRDWYIPNWHETPEDAAVGMALVKSVLETGVGGAFETTLINKEGHFVPYLISITRLMTPEGAFMMGVGIDITERKRIEEELAESMRRLRTVVDGAPIVLYSFDRHGVFTLSEGKGLAGLGIKPGEIVGKTIFEVYGDQPASIAALRRAMAGETFILELSFPAGSTFEVSHIALHDEAGEYNGTIGLLVDITERKRAEEALRESEERYRLLFSSINDAVFVHKFDPEGSPGRLIEVNDVACRRLGYTRQELLRMLPTDVDAPETLALLTPILNRLSAEGHAVWEGVHLTKDGRRIPVEVSDRLFELRGEIVGLATVRDISERKEAEEERRRLRNYLANIIDSMPSVLVGVDIDGCVTQWNAAAQKTTGISSEQAVGQPVEQVLPILGGELHKVKEAIHNRMVKSENRVPKVVDGHMQYLDVIVYPLVSDGLEGAVILVDDVTERVQIEEMMIQSEKMLSVGGLAAGMAHEINNPLGAILQASQNIVRRVSPELPANLQVAKACGTNLDAVRRYLEQREVLSFLEDIRSSGLRAAQIVENMLAFSRKPEGGGSSTDLAELLERTLVLVGSDYDLKKRYDFRQIEIVRDYAPDTPPVICQAAKMQQVFFNILRNGAEAMRETRDEGRVPRLVLRVLAEGRMVRVEIEDNGPGMDEATRKRIFEPFFTTKPPGSGTGLGLSVSYFIVTQDHKGSLTVASQPGKGSRFIIHLPIEGVSA